jgi:hypothetical protein
MRTVCESLARSTRDGGTAFRTPCVSYLTGPAGRGLAEGLPAARLDA